MQSNKKEIAGAAVLIILLLLLLNPLQFWMPSAVGMLILAILVVIFAVFASFILREKARDEREAMHHMYADRIAFLAGAGLLVIGITIQSLRHDLDPWLAYTLGAMIFAKLASLIYTQNHF
ncbi:MAG: hypothetical protein Q8R08_04645 [bacterium]|nr:hypothetical protein [bacterium]